jgi:3-methyladenine DNA glycosylase/8-oxoguanine DNA glycosylase
VPGSLLVILATVEISFGMTAISLAPRGLGYDPGLACSHLRETDPVLGAVMEQVGQCTLRPEPTQSLFAALARAIVYQQLSGAAAGTILRRVHAIYAPKRSITPRDVLATAPERLRAAGLSTAKTAALRDLAARTLDGTVPSMAAARRMGDDELVERLVQVRGVGRWTVEMLLIFRLGRPDVLPVSDLGIRKGFARTFGVRRLPAAVTITRRARRWRPYRTVASWYLWRALEL